MEIKRKEQITLDSFARLVQQMRHTQRRAQKFRKPETMEKAEEEEKEVDRQIGILFSKQLSIF